jgi:hypothetical protein
MIKAFETSLDASNPYGDWTSIGPEPKGLIFCFQDLKYYN